MLNEVMAIYVNMRWSNVGIYQGGRHAARRKRYRCM
jgi:hypothetical protein